MEDNKDKIEILKAIRESIASIALESDSTIDYDNLNDDDIEKIYKKLVKEKNNGRV